MKTTALRLVLGTAAVTASLLAATSPAGARADRSAALGRITCADTTGFVSSLHGVALLDGRVGGLRPEQVIGTRPSDDPVLVRWSKIPIAVKAGTKPFTIKLAPDQQQIAAMTWGLMRAYAAGIRVAPCSKQYADNTWSWYAGGFYATKPMCLHVIIDFGDREVRQLLPFGARC